MCMLPFLISFKLLFVWWRCQNSCSLNLQPFFWCVKEEVDLIAMLVEGTRRPRSGENSIVSWVQHAHQLGFAQQVNAMLNNQVPKSQVADL